MDVVVVCGVPYKYSLTDAINNTFLLYFKGKESEKCTVYYMYQ